MKKMKLLTTALCAGFLAIASLGLAGCTDNSREYLEAFEQSELVTQYSFDSDHIDSTPFTLTDCEIEMTEQDGYEVAAITATLQNENLKADMQVLGTKNEFDEYNFTLASDPVVTPTTGITYTYEGYKIPDIEEITETFDPETNSCEVTASNYVTQKNTLATETVEGSSTYVWSDKFGWRISDGSLSPTVTPNIDAIEGTYVGDDGTTITISDLDLDIFGFGTATISSNLTLVSTSFVDGKERTYKFPTITDAKADFSDEENSSDLNWFYVSAGSYPFTQELEDGQDAITDISLSIHDVDGELQIEGDVSLSDSGRQKARFSGPMTKQ